MADGFIVRRGGKVSEQALAPTITEVSVTDSSITFTIKNNDTETATIVYRIDDLTAEGESISLAGGATSSNITASGLDAETEYIVFATANVTGKVKSNVTQLAIETDEPIIFTAATGGTTNDYNLDGKRYRSHTFTTDANFVVTTAGNGDRNKVDYLIIAGGAGGGGNSGGGGGAGGYLTTLGATAGDVANQTKFTVTAQTYGVVIGSGGAGSGGAGSGGAGDTGANGTNSSVFSVSSTGGGGGGGGGGFNAGENGGSGGGGADITDSSKVGLGTTGQGRDGGGSAGISGNNQAGGGGGGAGQVGGNASSNVGGNGGDGLANLLRTGSNETRAGGGGGTTRISGTAGTGGAGGGGNGGVPNSGTGFNATANTGSGGGGGGRNGGSLAGGNGADGIVIIRYEIAPST
jgi:hypothetical protein